MYNYAVELQNNRIVSVIADNDEQLERIMNRFFKYELFVILGRK